MIVMNTQNGGYLELILGPMFSGKTTRLINLQKQYGICDISCCVINHILDKRYDDHLLCTHDRQSTDCFNMTKLGDIFAANIHTLYDVFLINEGQFFEDILPVVQKLVEIHHKKVYICGLDGDFKRQKFGQLLDLIPLADKVIKKSALCKLCKNGKKGIFTMRLTKEEEQIIVGSNNYIPVCRQCYLLFINKNDLD